MTVHPRDREIVGSIDTFYFCSFKFVSFFILSSQRFFPSEKSMYYERDQIKYLISFRKMGKKNSNDNNQRMSRRENVPTRTLNNSQEPPLAKIEKYFFLFFFLLVSFAGYTFFFLSYCLVAWLTSKKGGGGGRVLLENPSSLLLLSDWPISSNRWAMEIWRCVAPFFSVFDGADGSRHTEENGSHSRWFYFTF